MLPDDNETLLDKVNESERQQLTALAELDEDLSILSNRSHRSTLYSTEVSTDVNGKVLLLSTHDERQFRLSDPTTDLYEVAVPDDDTVRYASNVQCHAGTPRAFSYVLQNGKTVYEFDDGIKAAKLADGSVQWFDEKGTLLSDWQERELPVRSTDALAVEEQSPSQMLQTFFDNMHGEPVDTLEEPLAHEEQPAQTERPQQRQDEERVSHRQEEPTFKQEEKPTEIPKDKEEAEPATAARQFRELQTRLLRREATTTERAQILKDLQSLTDAAVDPDRTEFMRQLEACKTTEAALSLRTEANTYTVESLLPDGRIPNDPLTAERVITSLAAIANGANADGGQARAAIAILTRHYQENPNAAPAANRVLSTLLSSYNPAYPASLELAATLAAKTGEIPESLRKHIDDALAAASPQTRKAAFEALCKLPPNHWTDKDVAELKKGMTPSIAAAILKMPGSILDKHADSLIPLAIEKVVQGGSRSFDVFSASTENLVRELAAAERQVPRDESRVDELSKSRKAAFLALAEIARGRNGDKGEAASGQDFLKALANQHKNNKELLSSLMEAVAKAQPQRDDSMEGGRSSFVSLRTLGEISKLAAAAGALIPDTVRTAFESGLKSPSLRVQHEAINGLITFADNWSDKELSIIKANYSIESVKELALNSNAINKHKTALLEGLKDRVKSDNPATVESAVLALGMLGGKEALTQAGFNVKSEENIGKTGEEITLTDKHGTEFTFAIPQDKNVHVRCLSIAAKDRSLYFNWGDQPQTVGGTTKYVPVNGNFQGGIEIRTKGNQTASVVFNENYTAVKTDDQNKIGPQLPVDQTVQAEILRTMVYTTRQETNLGRIPVSGEQKEAAPPVIETPPDAQIVNTRAKLQTLIEQAAKTPPEKQAVELIKSIGFKEPSGGDQAEFFQRCLSEARRINDLLNSKDAATRTQAMNLLQRSLSDSSATKVQENLNRQRIDLITAALSDNSTNVQLADAKVKLEKELEAARQAGDRNGAYLAADRLAQVLTIQKINDLNAIASDAPDKGERAQRVLRELAEMAERGNPHAQATFAILINGKPNENREAQERTRDAAKEHGELKLPIPKIDVLTEAEQANIRKYAIGLIAQKAASTGGALTAAEAEAITSALLTAQQTNDSQTAALLTETLDTALRSVPLERGAGLKPLDGKQAALSAISAAIMRGTGEEFLVSRYLNHASPSQKLADLPQFNTQATSGNRQALAAIAGIAASTDSEVSRNAAASLKELATRPQLLDSVLLAALQAKDTVTGSRKPGLELFKTIATAHDASPAVLQSLHTQLAAASSSDRSAAAAALVSLSDKWSDADLTAIKQNMSLELARALQSLPQSSTEKHAQRLKSDLLTTANSETVSKASREAGVVALALIGGASTLRDSTALAAGAITTETTGDITTLTDKDGTKYQFSLGRDGAPRLERVDRTATSDGTPAGYKLFRYDSQSGRLIGAEELIAGNKLTYDQENRLIEVSRNGGGFVKVHYASDGKAASMVDEQGRGWDSLDGGRTWSARGANETAAGYPFFDPDGSIRFANERGEVIQRPDGTLIKFDKESKQTTTIEVNGSAITRNEGGKVTFTRDVNGVEREFVWSADNKNLVGVKDETGVWRASPDLMQWHRMDRQAAPSSATRAVDNQGQYKIHIAGSPEITLNQDGSRIVKQADGTVETLLPGGEKFSIKYDGAVLKEVTEPDGRKWQSQDGTTFTLLNPDGSASTIKATIERKDDGTIKRTLSGDTVNDSKGVLYKEVEIRPDGTRIARDSAGRVREIIGKDGERTRVEYEGNTEKVTSASITYRNGQCLKVVLNGKEDATTIGAGTIVIDKTTGTITATELKLKSGDSVASREKMVLQPGSGAKTYNKLDGATVLSEVYRPDGGRENLAWTANREVPSTRTIQNSDGSVATINARGQVTKVTGLAGGSLDIQYDANGKPLRITESSGKAWESLAGGRGFVSNEGQVVQGQFFVDATGKYGWRRSDGSTMTRDVTKGETVFTKPESFGIARATEQAVSVSLLENGNIQRDSDGRTVAVLSGDGKRIVASRDARGELEQVTLADPRTGRQVVYKREGGQWTRDGQKIENGTVELSDTGELKVFKVGEPDKPLYLHKIDGTEIIRFDTSREINDGYVYVVQRPDGQVSEYHYRKGHPKDTLSLVKQGTRNIDGSLNPDIVMRLAPDSAKDGKETPVWIALDHPEIRAGKMPTAQTFAVEKFEFNASTGATVSKMHRIPNGETETITTTVDGWKRTNNNAFETKTTAGGGELRRNSNKEIDHIRDTEGRVIDIKRNDGLLSEIRITAPGATEPNETLTSTDGKSWTRRYKDASGRWQEEKFDAVISIGADGKISERRGDGSSRILTTNGAGVSIDARTGDAVVTKSGATAYRVSFGVDGKPVKIAQSDGSYRSTSDGTTWLFYDKDGNRIADKQLQEKVEFDSATGTIRTEAVDGSYLQITKADGTFQRYEAVGQNKAMVLVEEVNSRGEKTKVTYSNQRKQETEITYPDKTVRKYNGEDRLAYTKDVNGKETVIKWNEGEPPMVMSFDDEKGKRWVRVIDGKEAPYFKLEGGTERAPYEEVYVNKEGKLECISTQASDISGLSDSNKSKLREVRGLDGRIVTYVGHGGITVRDASGRLERSITNTGDVRQFRYYSQNDKYDQPELSKIIMGDGEGFGAWERERRYWDNGKETLSVWSHVVNGKVESTQKGVWRLDQLTGDILTTRSDFKKEHWSLNGGGTWRTTDSGDNLQSSASEIKKISEKWSIQFTFDWNGRFNLLNPHLEKLSGDEILVMENYLWNEKNLDISEYIKKKWGGSAEGVILSGHVSRRAYTRDYNNAEKADVNIAGALAEMAEARSIWPGRTPEQLQRAVRDNLAPLNQRQLALLDKVHKDSNDGRSLESDIKEHPTWSWASTTHVHREAVKVYLKSGKDTRSQEDELRLIDLALEETKYDDFSENAKMRLELFKEFSGDGRVDQKVRDEFMAKGGDKKLERALVAEEDRDPSRRYEYRNATVVLQSNPARMMTHARDFMRDGRLSAATQLEDGNWGMSGNSKKNIEDIFKAMTPEERSRIRLGMELDLALSGEFGAKAREQAEALLKDPEKKKEAERALQDYRELHRVTGHLACFHNDRHQLEYLSAAAGSGFQMEMGEKVVNRFWWNSNKQSHMKSVEEIDRESFDLLSSDRALRATNDRFMKENFDYERGRPARALLDTKLDFAKNIKDAEDEDATITVEGDYGVSISLRELLPGTRNLSQRQYRELLDARSQDRLLSEGQTLQSQIWRGQELDTRIKAGEKIAADIAHGTKQADSLTPAQKTALQTYETFKKLAREPGDAKNAERDALEKRQHEGHKLTPAEAKRLAELTDEKCLGLSRAQEAGTLKDLVGERGILALEEATAFQHVSDLDSRIKEGAALQRYIDEGKLISAKLERLEATDKALAISNLSESEKARLELFERASQKKLSENESQLLELYQTSQRSRGAASKEQLDKGKELVDQLSKLETPQERAEARLKHTEEDKESIALYQKVERARKLEEAIDAGRSIAADISAGKAKEDTLGAQDKTSLALYKRFVEGKLPSSDNELLGLLNALKAHEANPDGAKLDSARYNSLEAYKSIIAYREDKTGVKAFFEGRDLARELDALPSHERQRRMLQLEEDPAKAQQKHALEQYRQTVFDGARDNVRRGFLEALDDNESFWGTDHDGMYDAIANMRLDERRRYATDAEFREKIDGRIKEVVNNSDARNAIEHLLRQIRLNPEQKPDKDVVFELYTKAAKHKNSPRELVESLVEALNGPNAEELRRKLNPNDKANYDPEYAKAFAEVCKRFKQIDEDHEVTEEELKEKYIDPILKNGTPSMDTLLGTYFSGDKMAALMMKMNEKTRQYLYDQGKDRLGEVFFSSTRQFIETILQQPGEIGIDDKLKAMHIGVLPKEELFKTLGSIKTSEERLAVINNYARKYGGHCITDMKELCGPADYGKLESSLRHRDWSTWEHWDNARQQAERTDNWGPGWSWDSSRDRLVHNQMGAFNRAFAEANRQYREMTPEEIARHEMAVFDAAKQHVDSQAEIAELASEALIAVAAASIMIATGGAAGPLVVALFTVAAGLSKVAVTRMIMGGNMNTNWDALGDEFRKGCISGFTQVLDPGQMMKFAGVGMSAAKQAASGLMRHAAFEGMSVTARHAAEKELAHVLASGLRQTMQGGFKKGAEQALVKEAMEVLVKKVALNPEQLVAVRAALQQQFTKAMEQQATKFIRNELTTLAFSQISGAIGSGVSSTADMIHRGDISMDSVLDGTAFNSDNLHKFGEQQFHALLGSTGGHMAGRFAHFAASPDRIGGFVSKRLGAVTDHFGMTIAPDKLLRIGEHAGMGLHLATAGAGMVGSMAAANYLGNNIMASMKGTAWNGEGFSQTVLNAGWAPFFTQMHHAYSTFHTPTPGRTSLATGLSFEKTRSGSDYFKSHTIEQVRGGHVEGTPHQRGGVVEYQGTRLHEANMQGKTAILGDGTHGTVSGAGTLEIAKGCGPVEVSVPKDQVLRLVLADHEAAAKLKISPNSEGRIEIYTPEGRPLPPELVEQIGSGSRKGKTELFVLHEDGRFSKGHHDGRPADWQPERNLNPEMIAKLRDELGTSAGTLTDREVVTRYAENIAERLDLNDGAQEAANKYTQTRHEFDQSLSNLRTALGDKLPPLPHDQSYSAAELRLVAAGDQAKQQIVEQYLARREAHAQVSEQLHTLLKERAERVKGAINKFAEEHGLAPIDLRVLHDVPAGAAAYRDGIIKIQTADLLNPRNLLEATYHELTHAHQDQQVLRLFHDELTAELGRKPSPEEVAQRYSEQMNRRVPEHSAKHWAEFVSRSLEGHNEPLSNDALQRARDMREAIANDNGQSVAKAEAAANSHARTLEMKQLLNTENGAQRLLHQLESDPAICRHLFDSDTPPREVLELIKQLPKENRTQVEVASKALTALLEKAGQGTPEGLAAWKQLFGDFPPPKEGTKFSTQVEREILSRIQEKLKLGDSEAVKLSQVLFGTDKPPAVALEMFAKPKSGLELNARELLTGLLDERMVKLAEAQRAAYQEYIKSFHEKEALLTQNLARRVAEGMFSESRPIELDFALHHDRQIPSGDLAMWPSKHPSAKELPKRLSPEVDPATINRNRSDFLTLPLSERAAAGQKVHEQLKQEVIRGEHLLTAEQQKQLRSYREHVSKVEERKALLARLDGLPPEVHRMVTEAAFGKKAPGSLETIRQAIDAGESFSKLEKGQNISLLRRAFSAEPSAKEILDNIITSSQSRSEKLNSIRQLMELLEADPASRAQVAKNLKPSHFDLLRSSELTQVELAFALKQSENSVVENLLKVFRHDDSGKAFLRDALGGEFLKKAYGDSPANFLKIILEHANEQARTGGPRQKVWSELVEALQRSGPNAEAIARALIPSERQIARIVAEPPFDLNKLNSTMKERALDAVRKHADLLNDSQLEHIRKGLHELHQSRDSKHSLPTLASIEDLTRRVFPEPISVETVNKVLEGLPREHHQAFLDMLAQREAYLSEAGMKQVFEQVMADPRFKEMVEERGDTGWQRNTVPKIHAFCASKEAEALAYQFRKATGIEVVISRPGDAILPNKMISFDQITFGQKGYSYGRSGQLIEPGIMRGINNSLILVDGLQNFHAGLNVFDMAAAQSGNTKHMIERVRELLKITKREGEPPLTPLKELPAELLQSTRRAQVRGEIGALAHLARMPAEESRALAYLMEKNVIPYSHGEAARISKDLHQQLVGDKLNETLFVYGDRNHSTVADSGALALHLYRAGNDLLDSSHDKRFVTMSQAKELMKTGKYKNVVYLNDGIGSGKEAYQILEKLIEYRGSNKDIKLQYAAFVASREGMTRTVNHLEDAGVPKGSTIRDHSVELPDNVFIKVGRKAPSLLENMIEGPPDREQSRFRMERQGRGDKPEHYRLWGPNEDLGHRPLVKDLLESQWYRGMADKSGPQGNQPTYLSSGHIFEHMWPGTVPAAFHNVLTDMGLPGGKSAMTIETFHDRWVDRLLNRPRTTDSAGDLSMWKRQESASRRTPAADVEVLKHNFEQFLRAENTEQRQALMARFQKLPEEVAKAMAENTFAKKVPSLEEFRLAVELGESYTKLATHQESVDIIQRVFASGSDLRTVCDQLVNANTSADTKLFALESLLSTDSKLRRTAIPEREHGELLKLIGEHFISDTEVNRTRAQERISEILELVDQPVILNLYKSPETANHLRQSIKDLISNPDFTSLSSRFRSENRPEHILELVKLVSDRATAWNGTQLGPQAVEQFLQSKEHVEKLLTERATNLQSEFGGTMEQSLARAKKEAADGKGPVAKAYKRHAELIERQQVEAAASISPVPERFLVTLNRYRTLLQERTAYLMEHEGLSIEDARTKASSQTEGALGEARKNYNQVLERMKAMGRGADAEAAMQLLGREVHNSVEQHLGDVHKMFSDLAKKNSLPEWRTTLASIDGADAEYSVGAGLLSLDIRDVLHSKSADTLSTRLLHELIHYKQDIKIVRGLAQLLEGQGIKIETPEGMNRLVERYRDATGGHLDERFAKEVLEHTPYKGVKLTEGELLESQAMAKSFKEHKQRRVERDNIVGAINEAETVLRECKGQADLQRWLSSLNEAQRKLLFGENSTSWLSTLQDDLQAGLPYETIERQIATRMDSQRLKTNTQYDLQYRFSLHEREAWQVDAETTRRLEQLRSADDRSPRSTDIPHGRSPVREEMERFANLDPEEAARLSIPPHTLPAGDLFIPGPDGRRIKVRIKHGDSVSMEQVEAVLARMVENGIRPNEIEFDTLHYARGSANASGTITIRALVNDAYYLTTYDHETGHWFDFTRDDQSPSYQKVTEAWQDCIKRADRELYKKGGELGEMLPATVDEYVRDLSNNYSGDGKNPLKYYASKAELMAEMFAIYMHERRLQAAGQRVPSFKEMVNNTTLNRDHLRADVIQHFEHMYATLRDTIFSEFATRQTAKDRFLASQRTPEHTASVREFKEAFNRHGGASQEFRTAYEKLQRDSELQARDALVDAIFAKEHGINLNFDPTRLPLELASKHRLYRRLTRDNYDPNTDVSLPEPKKAILRDVYAKYKENISTMETLSVKRLDALLRDITNTHLIDFMHRYAPGLHQDIENARQSGLDRVDPTGQMSEAYDGVRFHRMTTSELLADLYKVWLRKEGLAAQGNPPQSFDRLLRGVFDENRATELGRFPELWQKLERDVFPRFNRLPAEHRSELPQPNPAPDAVAHTPQRQPAPREVQPATKVEGLTSEAGNIHLREGDPPIVFGRTPENGLPRFVSREAIHIGRTAEGYFMRVPPNATATTSKTYFRIGRGPFVELTPQHGNVTITPDMEIRLGTRTGPVLKAAVPPTKYSD